MSERPVAVFAMTEHGHFQRLLPLIAGLVERSVPVHVFSDGRFRGEAGAAGAVFVDLFDRYPLERADDASTPFPCRFVTFAGVYAEQVIEDLRDLGPSLVIYDTFAVIGRVAARALGLPHVNVCAGHNMDPARLVPALHEDPRVRLAPVCLDAVDALRQRHGLDDASPFSYVSGLSPDLNVYCEPPAFLTPGEAEAFQPVAFHGSLPGHAEAAARDGGPSPFGPEGRTIDVYVSFGTVVWRYWAEEALAALAAISEALGTRQDVRAIVSLGGTDLDADAVDSIARPNIRVEEWVEQWHVLQHADVFVTHQGLNSTHEAIYNLVPMLSYPFFSDQPALAERCRSLGLAVPLAHLPRAPIDAPAVDAALVELLESREELEARLTEAREWEREVIAGRREVLDRVTALASS